VAIVVVLVVVLGACGDNFEGDAPAAPQVLSAGGPVLRTPEIVPIFFAGDDLQPAIEDFLDALPTSTYWGITTREYGVGTLVIEPTIVTSDAPPTTDDALQAWLEDHLASPVPAPGWIAPDPNTLYIVFLPAGVTLTAGMDTSCVTFGGYHDETAQSHIAYALVPRCATQGAPIDEVTPPTSHELIEAATDPHPETAPAFVTVDAPNVVWEYTPGAEVGDMCEYITTARQRLVGDFVVQRTWSNVSAAAGHDPCVPVLDQPYVAAAPILDDVVLNGTPTRGVQIATGSQLTFDVKLISDAPTYNWTIGVDDVASVVQRMPMELMCSIDRTGGSNGDTARVTIKRLIDGEGGGSEFVLVSKVDNVVVSLWWGLVTN
ncbi:MAG TPA: hypothetical protein VFQ65_11920, partial [Kofleriaceae bacterium]|nr:hypothetical protein [Kofleriaceae bacterium]